MIAFRDARAAEAGGYVLVDRLACFEVRDRSWGLPRGVAWAALVFSIGAWGRGIGSATGLYFLEPLIFANIPAFLWLGSVGLRIAGAARSRQDKDTTS